MGNAPAQDILINEYAHRIIRFKARQLSRRAGFSPSDEEDIRQEMFLYLFKQAPRFDSDRALPHTFIDRIVRSAAAIILRNRRRRCRAGNDTALSLEATLIEVEGELLPTRQTVSVEDLRRRTGAAPNPMHSHQENLDAFTTSLKNLSPSEQEICERLKSGSISVIARDLNVPRRQIRKVLSNVRKQLKKNGFEIF